VGHGRGLLRLASLRFVLIFDFDSCVTEFDLFDA